MSAKAVADYLNGVSWTAIDISAPFRLSANLQYECDEDRELRFYLSEPDLAMVRSNEAWRCYRIGDGDYEKALALLDAKTSTTQTSATGVEMSYALMKLGKGGEVLTAQSPLSGDERQLAMDVIFNYMIKSSAWEANIIGNS